MNKPVAWMRLTGDRVTRITLKKVQDSDIPLYTHPVKELTDEEITEVFRDCTKDGILDANDFARAILRKASEQ